ncbi:acetyltransferase [Pestalotiopsis sp. NC0098]|nr:acetyltransferase [Pestalotiopsis sp. NC0098]
MASTSSEVPASAIVTTDKCFIRPLEESDAPAIAAAANHPEIARFMRNRFPHPYTLDDANSWISLCSKREPRVDFDTECHTWELGYWLAKDQWGKGITTSAVKGFCKWAFAHFPELSRIEAGIYEGNDGSMKVLERVGFTKEGVRRKAVFKHGQSWDVAIFGLLRDEL